MDDVVETIELIKLLGSDVEAKCLHGNCYKFHRVLAKIYDSAQPYVNDTRDHVATRVGNVLYDVNGRIGSIVGNIGSTYHPMTESERKVAEKWGASR